MFMLHLLLKFIQEIKSYWWGDGDRPQKKDDHCLDELRYYIMSRPEPAKKVVGKTDIQKDKERLMRKLRRDNLSKFKW